MADYDEFGSIMKKRMGIHHYYGDYVRNIFFIGSVVILLSLPLFTHLLEISIAYSIIAALILVFVAGFANPAQRWTIVLNVIVALAAVVFFEWQALFVYRVATHSDWHQSVLFWESHALALLFLFALYYGIKTLRGRFFKKEITDVD